MSENPLENPGCWAGNAVKLFPILIVAVIAIIMFMTIQSIVESAVDIATNTTVETGGGDAVGEGCLCTRGILMPVVTGLSFVFRRR